MSSDKLVSDMRELIGFLEQQGIKVSATTKSWADAIVREAYWQGHEDGRKAYRDALREVRAEDEQRRAG